MTRIVGLALLALGFASSYFWEETGLLVAVLLWLLGTFFFARSFLNR